MAGLTLGIIGGGNMGAAIVRGAIRAGVLEPSAIIVAEPDQARRAAIAELGCAVTGEAREARDVEQILLAVKPQAFKEVAAAIGGEGLRAKIAITIMAGLNSHKIRAALGGEAGPRIVRVMPNTPCQVGAGMTAIALGDGAAAGDERLAMSLFGALGNVVMLDERHMHAVTAISGSGPAYVFLLAEAMQQAARDLGLPDDAAQTLVTQTMMGAGRLLVESKQSAAELRRAVTSPGGTTAAAIEVFKRRDFEQIVIEALSRARDRGVELDR